MSSKFYRLSEDLVVPSHIGLFRWPNLKSLYLLPDPLVSFSWSPAALLGPGPSPPHRILPRPSLTYGLPNSHDGLPHFW